MTGQRPKRRWLVPLARAVIETGFIVFLFYANLLMGEYTRGNGAGKSLVAALDDIITPTTLAIAIVSALVGHAIVEFLRRRL